MKILRMCRHSSRVLPHLGLLTLVGSVVSFGCGPTDVAHDSGVTLADSADTDVNETDNGDIWDAIYLGGVRVGYRHTTFTPVQLDGQTWLELHSKTKISVMRFGQPVEQSILVSGIESAKLGCRQFESRIPMGSDDMVTTGIRRDDSMDITVRTAGNSQTRSISWPADAGGFFAGELRLRAKPLVPGEHREFQAFIPALNKLALINLDALEYRNTDLLDGPQRLLEIKSSVHGFPALESTIWTDSRGEVRKERTNALEMVFYRTTRQVALAKPQELFDLTLEAVVKVGRKLPNPHTTRKIVYRATLGSGDIEGVLSTCGRSQHVELTGTRQAVVTVRSVRPDWDDGEGAVESAPTDSDLSANHFIESDDPTVVSLAKSIASDETDTWQLAQRLETHVHEVIVSKNLTKVFATAAEVARSQEGDCTEHAVLLAALCRARQIPARVAAGLVYYPREQGFAYHMWNEVWVRDRWIPMDATLGLGGIGAAHLKMVETSLDGDAYAEMLPVLQVMGQLQLEIVSVE